MLGWHIEMFPYHWGEFQTHAFLLVPSMAPIVSIVNLQSAKLTLEKQNSQPSLAIALCMCSVQVWSLAGPIKWNRPSGTLVSFPKSSHICTINKNSYSQTRWFLITSDHIVVFKDAYHHMILCIR